MPVAIASDALQNAPHLVSSEGLELPDLTRNPIDQFRNVSRQTALGDQLPEDLRKCPEYLIA
jgi:hypothetical protein